MWAGGFVALLLVPAFAVAGFQSARQRAPLLLLYAVPAFAMLGLHAVLANHYTRYNMILIGPFAAGVAWLIAAWRERRSCIRDRERARQHGHHLHLRRSCRCRLSSISRLITTHR